MGTELQSFEPATENAMQGPNTVRERGIATVEVFLGGVQRLTIGGLPYKSEQWKDFSAAFNLVFGN